MGKVNGLDLRNLFYEFVIHDASCIIMSSLSSEENMTSWRAQVTIDVSLFL
ncbi:hypothetical protein HMPREF0971_01965 [Segatella oris F0302]|uniref:Uncharacterized protein n=1 Tax=Segatella oris F0302 TaxID=649760 RepID=D1QSK6_9BACT|nr:hypothetical protein HMPREF0971_01965 [Segatella oris F0302]